MMTLARNVTHETAACQNRERLRERLRCQGVRGKKWKMSREAERDRAGWSEDPGCRVTVVSGSGAERVESDKVRTLQLPTVYSEIRGLPEFQPCLGFDSGPEPPVGGGTFWVVIISSKRASITLALESTTPAAVPTVSATDLPIRNFKSVDKRVSTSVPSIAEVLPSITSADDSSTEMNFAASQVNDDNTPTPEGSWNTVISNRKPASTAHYFFELITIEIQLLPETLTSKLPLYDLLSTIIAAANLSPKTRTEVTLQSEPAPSLVFLKTHSPHTAYLLLSLRSLELNDYCGEDNADLDPPFTLRELESALATQSTGSAPDYHVIIKTYAQAPRLTFAHVVESNIHPCMLDATTWAILARLSAFFVRALIISALHHAQDATFTSHANRQGNLKGSDKNQLHMGAAFPSCCRGPLHPANTSKSKPSRLNKTGALPILPQAHTIISSDFLSTKCSGQDSGGGSSGRS
ncbi:hypothetical protein HPB51_007008 [Rhipicephalus microplus]|uniref:Uncharacterized protein n=1 Tax=Rhipicephalus microplus TaxID=6941 RepID=A0A9J6EM31_RHIMP|nr:hypothetical protein HPB51_007008 [Rhipicephalus microplus]